MPKSILKTHMSRSVLFLFAFYMKGLFSVFKKNSFVRTCICIKVLDYNYFNCVAMGKLKLHKGYHIHKLLKRLRFVLSTSLTSLLWVHSLQVLRNMPIIITLQRFLTHSPLWLSTSSLHDSHYIAESHDKPQRPVTII